MRFCISIKTASDFQKHDYLTYFRFYFSLVKEVLPTIPCALVHRSVRPVCTQWLVTVLHRNQNGRPKRGRQKSHFSVKSPRCMHSFN